MFTDVIIQEMEACYLDFTALKETKDISSISMLCHVKEDYLQLLIWIYRIMVKTQFLNPADCQEPTMRVLQQLPSPYHYVPVSKSYRKILHIFDEALERAKAHDEVGAIQLFVQIYGIVLEKVFGDASEQSRLFALKTPLYLTAGQRLRHLVKNYWGEAQRDFAAMLEIETTLLSCYLNDRKRLSPADAEKIADFFGVRRSYLEVSRNEFEIRNNR